MTDKPTGSDYEGWGAIGILLTALGVYIRRRLGSFGNGNGRKFDERLKELEKWRQETQWKQDVLDEIDRRRRSEE